MTTTPPQGPKLVRGVATKLRLAGACAAVLSVGVVAAPRAARHAAPAPEEKVAPILAAEVERREPARMFRGVQDAGRKALAFSVAFPAPARPTIPAFADFLRPRRETPAYSGLGILAAQGRVLTHISALGGRTDPMAQFPDGTLASARLLAYEPETGLALSVETTDPPARLSSDAPSPGEVAVAAARLGAREFVAPVFIASVGADSYTLSAAGVLAPGTPIYDLSSDALAVAGAAETSTAFPLPETLQRLEALARGGRGQPRSLGLYVQPLTPALARLWGEGGVVVADIMEGGPAARAGLRAGDSIVRVAGHEVASGEDALARIAALPLGEPATVVVRRNGKERELRVEPLAVFASELSAPPPIPSDAPAVREAFPAPRLAAAGIAEDAALLSVNGKAVTRGTFRQALRRTRGPWLIRVQYGGRRFHAVLGDEE